LPLITFGATEQQSAELTLDQALEIAKKINPDLRLAQTTYDLNLWQRDQLAQTVGSIITNSNGTTTVYYNPSTQQITSSFLQTDIAYRTASKNLNLTRLNVEMTVLANYSNCIKAANDLEYAKLTLNNLEEQDKIYKIASGVGLISSSDYNKSINAREQAEAAVKAAESAWLKSLAALNKLIGKDENYRPVLTYKPSIVKYPRSSLENELIRGVPESSLIVSSKAALDVKDGEQYYPSTRTDTIAYNSGYEQTQINYEKAKQMCRVSN
jgi:outer membrane protein TolC